MKITRWRTRRRPNAGMRASQDILDAPVSIMI
jgi:hypothetical protein